jgi:hypothetical protein
LAGAQTVTAVSGSVFNTTAAFAATGSCFCRPYAKTAGGQFITSQNGVLGIYNSTPVMSQNYFDNTAGGNPFYNSGATADGGNDYWTGGGNVMMTTGAPAICTQLIWQPSGPPNNLDVSAQTFSYRNWLQNINGGGLNIRVTYQTPSGASQVIVDHASIATVGSATPPNTQNTPTELTVNGVGGGFTIPAGGGTVTTDFVPFTFLFKDTLMSILDFHGASATAEYYSSGNSNITDYQKSGAVPPGSYNLSNVTSYTANAGFNRLLLSVDTKFF